RVVQLSGPRIHLFGLSDGVGKVFVRKDGNCLSGAAEHFDDRLHEFVPGIQVLTPVVIWVVAMLADETDRIHREVVSSEGHGVFDCWINLEPVLFREATAQIVCWRLSRIHRYDAGARRGEDAIWRIAVEEPA